MDSFVLVLYSMAMGMPDEEDVGMMHPMVSGMVTSRSMVDLDGVY